MRSLGIGIGLFGAALIGALVTPFSATIVSAQSDAVWVSVSQGTELLATVAAKPMGELRREEILPVANPTAKAFVDTVGSGSRLALSPVSAVSMQARVVPVAQTSIRVPATQLDRNVPLTINGFVLRYWRSNGTAYVQVASVTGSPGVSDRESAMTTLALVPGESHELVEAKALGASPIVISASTSPAPIATIAARSH